MQLSEVREELLIKAATINQCIVLNGHKDCDEAVGIYVVGDGELARFMVGQVRNKRIELGFETENELEI